MNMRYDTDEDGIDFIAYDEGTGDEWRPDDNDSDDDESRVKEVVMRCSTIDDLVVEEMKYEAAICENLDNYGIEQTVFNEGEFSEIKRKERILEDR